MGAPPSFAADVKPLFRERDRRAMTFLFDLWDFEDVRSNAAAILAAIEAGDMPCDGPWPVERVQVIRGWIERGCRPWAGPAGPETARLSRPGRGLARKGAP